MKKTNTAAASGKDAVYEWAGNKHGQCEAAFMFYEQSLGGRVEAMIAHAGTPVEEHVPPEFRDKIMHVRLNARFGMLVDRFGIPWMVNCE